MKGTAERCGLCGDSIKVEDDDAVQYHGGAVGGLVHESCLDHLQEAAEGLVDGERALQATERSA